jgi:hypothetical protein
VREVDNIALLTLHAHLLDEVSGYKVLLVSSDDFVGPYLRYKTCGIAR